MSNDDTSPHKNTDKKARPKLAQEDDAIAINSSLNEANSNGRFPQLPEKLERDLVEFFKLLADETRIRILTFLMQEVELHVSALCDRLDQSQPAVSHHLALLRESGLITSRRDGKHNYYSVHEKRFHSLIADLFTTMSEPNQASLRFRNFVLTQE